MRGAVTPLVLRRPRALDDALGMLADEPELVPIAGATDLYVSLQAGTLASRRFLDVWPLHRLRRITRRDGMLAIGALATFAQLIRSRHVQAHLPMLARAAALIGGIQIRNRGTLGGNIGNASPAGDLLPVLAAADAAVVLLSRSGERRVPLTLFFPGYRRTVRGPGELIVRVEVPPVVGMQWFRKVGMRSAQTISKVVMAGVRADRPRIAFGSVAPTVVRTPRTEAVLAGGASMDEAAEQLAGEIAPIEDLRSTAEYRRMVAINLLRRFWVETA